jgi:TRAP-type mannitol/chloroaromatic compound transport system permease large subunit
MLAGIYCAYILVLGIVRPEMVPGRAGEERALISTRQLWSSCSG